MDRAPFQRVLPALPTKNRVPLAENGSSYFKPKFLLGESFVIFEAV
jgi:hypothetical protein